MPTAAAGSSATTAGSRCTASTRWSTRRRPSGPSSITQRGTEDVIRDREENAEQIRALRELKEWPLGYGFDISGPAATAQEAVQWLYFAYLGAVKEQNGAAMSLGRTSTFLDIYLAARPAPPA